MTRFIGTQNADIRSHLEVISSFLGHLWTAEELSQRVISSATGILLEQLCRFRSTDWALALAFLRAGAPDSLRDYVGRWAAGHFLPMAELRAADEQTAELRTHMLMRRSPVGASDPL